MRVTLPDNIVVVAAPKAFKEQEHEFHHYHVTLTKGVEKDTCAILVNAETNDEIPKALAKDIMMIGEKISAAKHPKEKEYFQEKMAIVSQLVAGLETAKTAKKLDPKFIKQLSHRADQKIAVDSVMHLNVN